MAGVLGASLSRCAWFPKVNTVTPAVESLAAATSWVQRAKAYLATSALFQPQSSARVCGALLSAFWRYSCKLGAAAAGFPARF